MQRRGNAPDAGPSHPLQTTTIGLHAADQGRRSPRSVRTQFRRRCRRSRNTGRTSVRTQRRVGAECATDAPVSSIAGKRDAWLSCSRAQATRGRQRSSAHTTSRENPRQKIAGSCRCCVLGHDLWFGKKSWLAGKGRAAVAVDSVLQNTGVVLGKRGASGKQIPLPAKKKLS